MRGSLAALLALAWLLGVGPLQGVYSQQYAPPSESECRPYIERALKEQEHDHASPDTPPASLEDTGSSEETAGPEIPLNEQTDPEATTTETAPESEEVHSAESIGEVTSGEGNEPTLERQRRSLDEAESSDGVESLEQVEASTAGGSTESAESLEETPAAESAESLEQGDAPAITEEGSVESAESVEQVETPATEDASAESQEQGETSATDEDSTESLEQGDAPATEEGSTESAESVEQGESPAAVDTSAESVEQGETPTTDEASAESLESIEQGETTSGDNASAESVEEPATSEGVEGQQDSIESTEADLTSAESLEQDAAPAESIESSEETIPVESSESGEQEAVPTETTASSESSEETAVPAESAESSEETAVPAETSESSEETVAPAESSESSEETAVPAESSESSEETAAPAESSKSSEETAAPAESSESSEETAVPAESAESSEETAVPAESAESSEETAVPAESSENSEESAVPAESLESVEQDTASIESAESSENLEGGATSTESVESSESQEPTEEVPAPQEQASAESVESTEQTSEEVVLARERRSLDEDGVSSEAGSQESAEETVAEDTPVVNEEQAELDHETTVAGEAAPTAADEEETEVMPVEELSFDVDIPDNLRPRDHIAQILKLDETSVEDEMLVRKVEESTLKELKRLYDNAIKPLEILYKYRDLSNRHFGDPEIFSKPLILFMGPWSGGKSTIINYLLDNEYTRTTLRTGAEPSPAYFNLLMWGEREEVLDGTQLAADWTFSGLQKFGQGLLDRLRGLRLKNRLLEKVNIVEIPGILEIRKQVERLFPFNDACQWFIDRADIIFLVYDPSKLDVGPETEAILDQLKGREYQTRIVLNKADQVRPEELMRVQGTLIWNISPLMSSSQPPVMYSTSLWSMPYEAGAPLRLLRAQERAFLRDMREAIDKRVENKIASARRFAVRVRNHAKMVDCYLTTYYNHKSFFGNRKRISDDIIEKPQDYHIYEGLSTLTNISRYDLPDPETYRDFFQLNPLYDFQQLAATCTYFKGCPINRLDIAIAYDLPELVGKYKKAAEIAIERLDPAKS